MEFIFLSFLFDRLDSIYVFWWSSRFVYDTYFVPDLERKQPRQFFCHEVGLNFIYLYIIHSCSILRRQPDLACMNLPFLFDPHYVCTQTPKHLAVVGQVNGSPLSCYQQMTSRFYCYQSWSFKQIVTWLISLHFIYYSLIFEHWARVPWDVVEKDNQTSHIPYR